MFLVNSRLGVVSATLEAFTPQVPLIPKLRGYFAEFLHHDYLDRLSILYSSTCVGLGYGRLTTRSRSFSWHHRITEFNKNVYASRFTLTPGGFTYPTRHTLTPGNHHRVQLPSCVPPQLVYYTIGSHTHLESNPEGKKTRLTCLASHGSTWTLFRRYGNINPLSIDYACRPRLRSRLTQGRLA